MHFIFQNAMCCFFSLQEKRFKIFLNKIMEINQFLHHAMALRPRRSQNNGLKARVILGTPQPSTIPYLRRFVLFIYLFILFYFLHFSHVAEVAIIH